MRFLLTEKLRRQIMERNDRFVFPDRISRVTAGHGGEALLIRGGDKYALLDCGMAYCGKQAVENIKKITDRLDFILLSHSHYDHIGALPYILDEYPEATVCGGEKCKSILQKDSAKALMRKLGTDARNLYEPDSLEEIRTDNLRVDRVLHDGDLLDLGGGVQVSAWEMKGHTDCSIGYMLEPERLLFTSESTGILEWDDYVHTPVLKNFTDAFDSLEKCRKLNPERVCLPHYGMLPKGSEKAFFDAFVTECFNKIDMVKDMKSRGLSRDEMLEEYIEKYWDSRKLKEQPFEAFAINSGHVLDAIIRYVGE